MLLPCLSTKSKQKKHSGHIDLQLVFFLHPDYHMNSNVPERSALQNKYVGKSWSNLVTLDTCYFKPYH